MQTVLSREHLHSIRSCTVRWIGGSRDRLPAFSLGITDPLKPKLNKGFDRQMKSYKKDLIDSLSATNPNITKQNLGLLVDSVLDAIDHLTSKEGQTLTLRDFGTFKCTLRAARTARNPQNGAVVSVPAKLVRSFKASNPIATGTEV